MISPVVADRDAETNAESFNAAYPIKSIQYERDSNSVEFVLARKAESPIPLYELTFSKETFANCAWMDESTERYMAPPYPPLSDWESMKEESEMDEDAQLVRMMCRQLPPFISDVDESEEEEEEEAKVDVMESNVHPWI